jgi:hypothetical protein
MSAPSCRRRLARARAPLLLILLQGAALAGCGGSSHHGNGVAERSPTAILAAAQAASEAASSVHVRGSIEGASAHESFDIEILARRGTRGSVTTGGASFELIETGGTLYLKGDAAFYERVGGKEAARRLQGKWLKAPATDPRVRPVLRLTDLHGLVSVSLAGHSRLAAAGTSVIDGVPVVGVRDSAKRETVYVATSGQPYPMQISKTGIGAGTLRLDRWNARVALAPPAHAIDLAALQSNG